MLAGPCRLIGPTSFSLVFAGGRAAPLPAFGHPLPGGEGSVGSRFMGAARPPSPARAAWPNALSFVAGEGRGWGNIKLSFHCDTGPRPLTGTVRFTSHVLWTLNRTQTLNPTQSAQPNYFHT